MLPIIEYPHPILKSVSQKVTVFDESLIKLTQDMLESMYVQKGIGLSAIQVGIPKRVIAIDLTDKQNHPMIFINPEFQTNHHKKIKSQEGCLSLPDAIIMVPRYKSGILSYQDIDGQTKNINVNGLLSICIQHEIDHLNGKVLLDYLKPMKRKMMETKIKKWQSKH